MSGPGPLTAGAIAALVGGELLGPADVTIAGVASLREAGPGDLAFLASGSHASYFRASRAGAVLVAPEFRSLSDGPATRIIVVDPRAALGAVIAVLVPAPPPDWGVHATAVIGRGTRWDPPVAIGAGAVLGRDVRLGANCRIGPHVVVEDGAVLGNDCRLDAHAFVGTRTRVGHRVLLKAGARVGTPGYGFVNRAGTHVAVPQVGGCHLEDDVEVGANSTVDRGSIGTTVIGAGTKIDNLVQIAHNVRVGRRCLIMAQVGIAGTTTIGDDVSIAGQAGLAGQLDVGSGARIAAQSGVIGDIAAGATVSGYPARDHRSVLRQAGALRRLTPLVSTLERMATAYGEAD